MSENPENQGQRPQEGDFVSTPVKSVEKKPTCRLSTLSGVSLFVPAIVIFLAMVGIGFAEGAVEFGDVNLKKIVEDELGKKNPTAEDMLKIEWIRFYGSSICDITSLKGLEYAENLRNLNLKSCLIQDFSVLAKLKQLELIRFDACGISDLTGIVSAIESHDSLQYLWFNDNQIADISPLMKLKSTQIDCLDLNGNPLNDQAYQVFIPQLRKKIATVRAAIPFRSDQLVMPAILFVLLCLALILMIVFTWKHDEGILGIIYEILSAGVGGLLGLGAQILYLEGTVPFFGNGYTNPMWIGGVAGCIFGFLAGIWFTQFLRGLLVKGHGAGGIIGKGVLGGIGLGMFCSVAIHAILMTAYRSTDSRPVLIGVGFGLGAGIAAGLVFSVCFVLIHIAILSRVKENV